MKPQSIRRGVGMYLLSLFIATCCFIWFNARVRHGYAIGDWLINYSGGFVRRGLTGEVLLALAKATHIQLPWVVASLQVVLYGFIFLTVYLLLREIRWSWAILALLLSPATLAFQVLGPTAGSRKEIMLFALLALLICLARRRSGPASDNWLSDHPLSSSLLLIGTTQICILSHEGISLYLPYHFAVVLIAIPQWRRYIKVCIAPVILACVSFVAVAMHPGSWKIAEAVCWSVGGTVFAKDQGICGGAIFYFTHDLAYTINEVRETFFRYDYPLLYGPRIILSLAPAAYLVFHLMRKAATRRNATIVLVSFVIALCNSLLLYYVVTDWGRWTYIHAMCLLLLLLLIDRKSSDRAMGLPAPGMSRTRIGLAWVVLAIYSTCWTLPLVGIYPARYGYVDLYRYLRDYKTRPHPNWRNSGGTGDLGGY